MKSLTLQHIVAVHSSATLFMMGLIWFVQVVHYPLFENVGVDQFAEYERLHSARTTWVVLLPMLAELFTAAILCAARPPHVGKSLAMAGLALVIVIWISTFALQVPCHETLTKGFDAAVHKRLVLSNWIRTVGWTLRGFIALLIASRPS